MGNWLKEHLEMNTAIFLQQHVSRIGRAFGESGADSREAIASLFDGRVRIPETYPRSAL
jgi:hypothetical protein